MDVLIASGQPNLRFSLEVYLRQQPGIVVAGSVSTTESLLAVIHAASPDVVIMDWALPGREKAGLLSEAKAAESSPYFVILGRDENASRAALDAGADDFLLQGDYPADLWAAIRRFASDDPATDQNEEEE